MAELHQLTSQNWPHFGISEITKPVQIGQPKRDPTREGRMSCSWMIVTEGRNCRTMYVLAKGWPRTEAPGSLLAQHQMLSPQLERVQG